jgi:subtilisin family serine protease
MKYLKYLLISTYLFVSCKETKIYKPIAITSLTQKVVPLNKKETQRWFEKDILIDSVPGISLNRAYDSLLKGKTGKSIVVAVIDTEIDINHEDLKSHVWINTDEIPNNGIDDDQNGYVDDVNGWNFIGNSKGDNIIFSSLECVRVIQGYQKRVKEGKLREGQADYTLYIKAKKYYDSKLKSAQEDLDYGNFLFEGYPKAKSAMKKIFPEEDYTVEELDSTYEANKKINPDLARNAYFMSDCFKYNLSEEWIANYRKQAKNKIDYTYNLNYIDKVGIDPFPNEITFNAYGTHNINKNLDVFYHGTLVAGLIGATRNNGIGINGVASDVEIMSLAISSNGEEHDKDIALAIKYAVDNGAKVINMSFGKEFSMHKEWVFEAFEYAEKKDVIIISSAGNSAFNLEENNNYYPNDNINNGTEVSNNFLLVGSISKNIDSSFLSYYSNYGVSDVDIFAPGQEIYTIIPNNEYKLDSGTSIAASITSGVAALIYSYYPNLKASEVKQILMDSGLEFNIEVTTPIEENKEKTTPFNQLSKSGKVLNAYNALIMADSISKNK